MLPVDRLTECFPSRQMTSLEVFAQVTEHTVLVRVLQAAAAAVVVVVIVVVALVCHLALL